MWTVLLSCGMCILTGHQVFVRWEEDVRETPTSVSHVGRAPGARLRFVYFTFLESSQGVRIAIGTVATIYMC